ncbi:hypothetical protein [Streptomyces sp. AM 2-1-1]|uniref:hypothetical protein n=1 Tax=Streptomyces sp. AM 2-1-1 TaxID=3028709 RepID=UPI0023B8F060|nr:hypothetical protein [Streptomyces sp. AM 2-1-1]WEH38093.1 hypothetical protein PZB77_00390 [Streptomyces sp. AM 2-1-1]
MSVFLECEYKGRRYAGLDLPADGAFHELYAVREGQLRDALVAGSGPADVAKALRAGGEVLSVAVGDRELRFLRPRCPRRRTTD